MITIAFDIYGTLIDTNGINQLLTKMMGEKATNLSKDWRNKQLEYTFRRALMAHYQNFEVCTAQALDYVCADYQITLSEKQKQQLLLAYQTLPLFPDVSDSLSAMKNADFALFAFSNGTKQGIDTLLKQAKISHYFLDIISADEIKTFKPDPAIYSHFIKRTQANKNSTWLVSSNPFDIIGGHCFGLKTAWLQRSKTAVFDPWQIKPTQTIQTLRQLCEQINTAV